MKDERSKALDNLLDAYDRALGRAKKSAQQAEVEEIEFEADFSVCRDQVIRPAMQEIGDHLRKRGHAYQIYSSDEDVDPLGKTTPAVLTILFYPAGIDRSRFTTKADTPHVSFIAKRGSRKVLVSASDRILGGGGGSGPIGEFSVQEVDSNFVEEQILAVIKRMLSNVA